MHFRRLFPPLEGKGEHMHQFIKWIGIELDVASQREKFVSLLGGVAAICALIYIVHDLCELPLGTGLIASMGASAVLLFAVPHGQLSQPWPVIAGHTVSALIGVTCAQFLPGPTLAAGCAVGLSIWVMHQMKCIHPPGGATALVAVLGGEAVHSLGYQFVLAPVMANAVIMVILAIALNYGFKWRRYPVGLSASQEPVSSGENNSSLSHEQILHALRELDLFIDVAEEDLVKLIQVVNTGDPQLAKSNPALGKTGAEISAAKQDTETVGDRQDTETGTVSEREIRDPFPVHMR